ncbi:MAG: acyltransferase [Pseudomonadota bacterium]
MAPDRYYSLDFLRGIAALSVAVGHYAIDGIVPIDGVISEAYQTGFISNFSFIYAVDFFLVLSGFILAHSYFESMNLSLKDFALRRFFRMYPLHLLTLLATVVIFLALGLKVEPEAFLIHLFFVQNMGLGPGGLPLNTPAWTISVEFWINIGVFSALLLIRPRRLWHLAAMGLVAMACYSLILLLSGHMNVNSHDYKGFVNSGLIRCLADFLLGVVTYKLYLKTLGWRPHTAITCAVCAAFASIILFLPGQSLLGFLTPVVFCLVVFVAAHGEVTTAPLTRRMALLGSISFSIYLVHHPVITIFREIGIEKTWGAGMIYLVIVLGLSILSFRYFERPVYKGALARTAKLRARTPKKAGSEGRPEAQSGDPVATPAPMA